MVDCGSLEVGRVPLERANRLDFTVAGEAFSLPLAGIAEVLRPRALARPPHAPPSLLGIANLRGTVLPVVSAAALLGRERVEATKGSRILVLDRDAPCGLMVDRLGGSADGPARPLDTEALLASAFAQPTFACHGEAAPSHRERAAIAADAPPLPVLGFTVAGRAFALPLDDIEAVLTATGPLTGVIDSDPVIAGLVEHRASVLPVVALARLLGLPCPDPAGPLLIARLAGGLVGLAVDALRGIARLSADRLEAVPAVLTRGGGETRVDRIARDHDGTLVAVLAVGKLFDEATQQRLSALAQPPTVPLHLGERRERFIAFDVGTERFALPIAAVAEVARRPARLAAVPAASSLVLGAIVSRGRVVPLIDGGERLGAAAPARRDGKLVVVALRGVQVALAVDALCGSIEVAADEIVATPIVRHLSEAKSRAIVDRVVSHYGRCVFLIDPHVLLDVAEKGAPAMADGSARDVSARA